MTTVTYIITIIANSQLLLCWYKYHNFRTALKSCDSFQIVIIRYKLCMTIFTLIMSLKEDHTTNSQLATTLSHETTNTVLSQIFAIKSILLQINIQAYYLLIVPQLVTSYNFVLSYADLRVLISRASEGIQYWGAESILCGVMKGKNLIFAKGKEYENMLPRKILNFSSFQITV